MEINYTGTDLERWRGLSNDSKKILKELDKVITFFEKNRGQKPPVVTITKEQADTIQRSLGKARQVDEMFYRGVPIKQKVY